jgi:hypothetical protein
MRPLGGATSSNIAEKCWIRGGFSVLACLRQSREDWRLTCRRCSRITASNTIAQAVGHLGRLVVPYTERTPVLVVQS